MKRILVILSILMITGVSAQEITNLKFVNQAWTNKYSIIQWDVENATSSYYKNKNTKKWHKAKPPITGESTYGIAIPTARIKNRIYTIQVKRNNPIGGMNFKIHRITIINPLSDTKYEIFIPQKVSRILGKKVFVNKYKGKVVKKEYDSYGTILTIEFQKKFPHREVNSLKEEVPVFLWYKYKIR